MRLRKWLSDMNLFDRLMMRVTVVFDDGTQLSAIIESPKKMPRLGETYEGRIIKEIIAEPV